MMSDHIEGPRIAVQVIRLRGRRDLVHDLRGIYIPPAAAAVIELDGEITGYVAAPAEAE